MADASRIFVRGLPPSYTEDEFQKYFGSRFAVTDTRLFPRRRFGYVGFKTAQEAAKAVKYFNRSFIRMSRIQVEVAREVGCDSRLSRRDQSAEMTVTGHACSKCRASDC